MKTKTVGAINVLLWMFYFFGSDLVLAQNPPAVADSVSMNEPVYHENEVDVLPVYKNGMVQFFKFLSEKINIPDDAFKSSVNGSVILSFIVEKDGRIGEVKVVRSLMESCDNEAIRVIKLTSGNWTASKKNGVAVRTLLTTPIKFKVIR